MERIVIKVEDATAKKWQNVSPEIKHYLEKNFEKQIDDILIKVKEHKFDMLLQKASDEAASNGLTEDILHQLLNEK